MDTLKLAYLKLKNSILQKNDKIIDGSIFLSFLIYAKSKTIKHLNESAINKNHFSIQELDELLNKGFIRHSDDTVNHYCLTALGVWTYENDTGVIDVDRLIKYFDKKKYMEKVITKRNISKKEKVFLLTMIGLRSFSSESCIKCTGKNKNRVVARLDILEEIVFQVNQKLFSWGVIGNLCEFSGSGGQHNITYAFSRFNSLPIITRNIYKYSRGRKYWLDIYDKNSADSQDRLTFLFKLVFSDKLPIKLINEIDNYLNTISLQYTIKVINNSSFSNPHYRQAIKDALVEAIL